MRTNTNSTLITLTTHPDMEQAKALSAQLVEERLVACANIIPSIFSIYRWQGKIEQSNECLILTKTNSEKIQALEVRIKELHPYDTPEFVVLESKHVEERYLAWLSESLLR